MTERAIGFRPMTEEDLRLVHEWLRRPHVQRWWNDRPSYEGVRDRYLPAIEGTDPTDLYIAHLDGRPIGFVQTYLVSSYPGFARLVGAGEGVAGMDLLIGEEELTGRGLGTELIRRFAEEVVFANPATSACLADPHVENLASIRAFEKAGFRIVDEIVDPEDGEDHYVVRRERADTSLSPDIS
jgi:RimJ/RimL family protein N-acetyltransferase